MVHRSAFQGMTFDGRPVVPIRFVQACVHGHVGDVDWMTFVHRGASSCEALYLAEAGTTGDFAELFVRSRISTTRRCSRRALGGGAATSADAGRVGP